VDNNRGDKTANRWGPGTIAAVWLLFWVSAGLAQQVHITSVRDNRVSYPAGLIPQYEKLELSFNVANLAAENVSFPYEAEPIPGLPMRIGVTVDGLFLPPGETDWSRAIVQPAFWYQPMRADESTNFLYPEGEGFWKVRFAPMKKGEWKYKIRVQDRSICDNTYPCDRWVESETYTFSVTDARPENHGFIEVSPDDRRYFRFADGAEFMVLGLSEGAGAIIHNPERRFRELTQHGINFIRVWMTSDLIVGRGTHGWDPWKGVEWPDRVGAKDGVEPYGFHDFSVRLSGNGRHIAITGNQPIKTWLEAEKKYIVRIRAKLNDVIASGAEPSGLVVKFLNDPYSNNFISTENTKLLITSTGWKGSSNWQLFEASFVNPFGRRTISWGAGLAIGLQNISSGAAYLDEIYVGEDLGDGRIGPNILFKGQFNYHLFFEQRSSYLWDNVFEAARKCGIYIKPVILEKNDPIYNGISLVDGSFDAVEKNNDNFYAKPNTKVRRLHEYFWRYLAARWGYCTAIHSWELLNEGDPFNNLHYDQADALKRAVAKWDRNHLVSTSFWHSFPTEFWRNTLCDYADVHAYISTTYAPRQEKEKMQYDAAYYHIWHSKDIYENRNPNKPVIRGEAGLDFPDRQDRNPLLEKDRQGVWFHNFLWAGLYYGGMYDLYWWTEDVVNEKAGYDHRNEFLRLESFLKGLDLAKGGYQDWAGKVSNDNIRVVGQKNVVKGCFHLWIQNKKHTWKNVIDKVETQPEAASIAIDGFKPGETFLIEWWDTYTGKVIKTENKTVEKEMVLTLPFGLTSDIAVKGVLDKKG